ncbi:MAG: rRNA cytosine-C5-methyltransferase [Bacteroidales bacterium]|nr:rRNA cytosine-C5-methyltransferase [Bacteroidales bacterium]
MADSSSSNIPVAIRTNPFKDADLQHLQLCDPVPWSPFGYYLKERPSFTLDPLFHAGAYYVQDASAMLVGWMFRSVLPYACAQNDGSGRSALKVLDLCAAPGGKTTDMSASLGQSGLQYMLVSNEVIHQRALALMDNVARWGDPNVLVTNSDPKEFSKLDSFFDIIVADVPCSGEGMFRKSENARQMWSEDNVQLCAARQRRIVADAWKSLRPGGVLVYSTCTLNDSENDDNVAWILEELGGSIIPLEMPFEGPKSTKYGFLMVPGEVRGEGQYCAAVFKGDAVQPCGTKPGENMVEEASAVEFFEKNSEIFALPAFMAQNMGIIGKKLNVLNAGVHAFSVKGRDKIPYEDLALSAIMQEGDFPDVALEKKDALRFLHKDALQLKDAPTGYVTVSYQGLCLGFVKNLGNRANNLHPSGRRIMMNVE